MPKSAPNMTQQNPAPAGTPMVSNTSRLDGEVERLVRLLVAILRREAAK